MHIRSYLTSLVLAAVSAVALVTLSPANHARAAELRIASGFGLGYAPVQLAHELKLFEKYAPGLEVKYQQYASGSARSEAMIAGQADVAFMGIQPYLIGWARGVEWKVIMGLNNAPVHLMTWRDDVKSLKDIKPEMKIAVPSPTSTQADLLRMAAARELGDAKALDGNMVAMKHPDAANAIISKRGIDMHFASPPFLFKEAATPGVKKVLTAIDAFGGEHNFLVAVGMNKFAETQPAAFAALTMGIMEAMHILNTDPKRAAKAIAGPNKLSEEDALQYLTWENMNFTATPYGVMTTANWMKSIGVIPKAPEDIREILFPVASAIVGRAYGEPSGVEKLQGK
ncbi:MAG: ABC transporter substrate-binding protein [Hyphomicrobiales bacterium]